MSYERSPEEVELRPTLDNRTESDRALLPHTDYGRRHSISSNNSDTPQSIPHGLSTATKSYSLANATEIDQTLRQRKRAPANDADLSGVHTFLRSVGLKVLSSGKRRGHRRHQPVQDEPPKPAIIQSRTIAITRTGVHILPVFATVFLICFNAVGFLNGPEISTSATFFLQLVSKFHELAIVGSLTCVVVDTVRYYLITTGINLGLVTAGSGFSQLNFLWSTDFLSTAASSIPRRSKIFIVSLVVFCCLLASTVGPASALLFVPTQLWLPAASTDYYIVGTEEQLYPLKLTANETGPDYCKQSPLRFNGQCLHAGWKDIFGEVSARTPQRIEWGLLMNGAGTGIPKRVARGWAPDQGGIGFKEMPESWGVQITAVIAAHMAYLKLTNDRAWAFAKGRNRRLRDFVDGGGGYAVTWGKMPVVRTDCAHESTVITNETTTLPFPVLSRDEPWRKTLEPGPYHDVEIAALDLGEGWNGLQPLDLPHRQVRSEWIALPREVFGQSTSAGLVFLTQSDSTTVARGCVVDGRWAEGENLRKAEGFLYALESQVGKEEVEDDPEHKFERGHYFDKKYTPYYGPTIEMTKEWFDGWVLPMPEQTASGSNFTQTSFEALLNQSALVDPKFSTDEVDNSRILLEYFINIFLLDALSRIGWDLQTDKPDGDKITDAVHDPPEVINDKMLNGGPIWNPPPFPHITARYETYKYGTAWYLKDSGQWISFFVLGAHLVVAFVHSVIIVWTGKTSEAWDSNNELIALAYNTQPNDEGLENCGGGIVLMDTLKKVVKVGKVEDESGIAKAQLVLSDERQNGKVYGEVVLGEKYK